MTKDGEDFLLFKNVFPNTKSGRVELSSSYLDEKYAAFRTSRDDMPSDTAAHYTGRTFYRFVPDARVL